MAEELFYANGINGISGDYLLPPLEPQSIVRVARGSRLSRSDFHLQDIKNRLDQQRLKHLGVTEGVDATKLEESGWGVIFAHDANPAIREALKELLDLRKRQATRKNERFYREFTGPDGYRPGESKREFLERFNVGSGPVDPENGVPYYLLIVGDPETIPYTFQYQLDIQFSVGRIHFETLDEYAFYARSVVESESGRFALPRKATFFGVRNQDDIATRLSVDNLITPLAEKMKQSQKSWDIRLMCGDEAMKTNLSRVLGGAETPALLYTASHGMAFPKDYASLLRHQGALLCQDWPGPREWRKYGKGKEIPADFFFSGDDLGASAQVLGMIAFFFACYGGGTPRFDDFYRQAFKERQEIAPHAFLAYLPRRMLAHPKGGALAVVAHVERAWGYSFLLGSGNRQLEVFESALNRLMQGHPLGLAMEPFNERYAEIAADLNVELEAMEFSKQPNPMKIASMWTINHDARNYMIIGDPAVRLPIKASTAARVARPTTVGSVTVPKPAIPLVAYPMLVVSGTATLVNTGGVPATPATAPVAFDQSDAAASLPPIPSPDSRGDSVGGRQCQTPTERDIPPSSLGSSGQGIEGLLGTSDVTTEEPIATLIARWREARAEEARARTKADRCVQELGIALYRKKKVK